MRRRPSAKPSEGWPSSLRSLRLRRGQRGPENLEGLRGLCGVARAPDAEVARSPEHLAGRREEPTRFQKFEREVDAGRPFGERDLGEADAAAFGTDERYAGRGLGPRVECSVVLGDNGFGTLDEARPLL